MPNPENQHERQEALESRTEKDIFEDLQELRKEQGAKPFPKEFLDSLTQEEKDIITEEVNMDSDTLENLKHVLYNLEVAFDEWENPSTSDATEDEAGESTDVGEANQERSRESREKSRGMSREKVLADLLENPDKYFKEEDGVYTMLFPKGSAAEKYIQIQHIINKNYENSDYFIQKVQDGEGKIYEWNADKIPASFYDGDGNRLLIYSGDVVKVYKHGETPSGEQSTAAEQTGEAVNLVGRPDEKSSAKVEALMKEISENPHNLIKEGKGDRPSRDDLIAKIDMALATEQISEKDKEDMLMARELLSSKETAEDSKERHKKLSAAWEKEYKNIVDIIAAAKAKNPNLEFDIESRGPRENNKILTLKANGREAKIKITVWPLGKADYSPQGATKVWDTARENGKNVMADVLYKQKLPKAYDSVDEITRTVTEWVSGVKVEGTFQPRAEAPAAAPVSTPVAGESREERAARVTRESEAAAAAEIDSYVPRREVYVDAAQGTYDSSATTEAPADETARREVYRDAATEDTTDITAEEDAARARTEAYRDAGTTEAGRTETISDAGAAPAGDEVIDGDEVPSTPMTFDEEEATGAHEADPFGIDEDASESSEELRAKEKEIREKYKLEGTITNLEKRSDGVYTFKYNNDTDIIIRGDSALDVQKTLPDGGVVTSVFPENWRGIDAAISEMGSVRETAEAVKSDIDIATEKAKEDLGLKGDIDIVGKKEIMDGTDRVTAFIIKYRGEEIRSIPQSDGYKYYLIIDRPAQDELHQVTQKGEADRLIDSARVKYGPKEGDRYYENNLEQSKEELKARLKLRGDIQGEVVTSKDMQGRPVTEFKYRGHTVRMISEPTGTQIEIRDLGMIVDETKSETVDGEIDFDEKYAPKEYTGADGMVTFIAENGGDGSPAERLVDKLLNAGIPFEDITIEQYHSPSPNDKEGDIIDTVAVTVAEDEMKGRREMYIRGSDVVSKTGNKDEAIRKAISITEKYLAIREKEQKQKAKEDRELNEKEKKED